MSSEVIEHLSLHVFVHQRPVLNLFNRHVPRHSRVLHETNVVRPALELRPEGAEWHIARGRRIWGTGDINASRNPLPEFISVLIRINPIIIDVSAILAPHCAANIFTQTCEGAIHPSCGGSAGAALILGSKN